MKKNVGFSLLELVIVVIVVGILASLSIAQYNKMIWRSRFAEVYQTVGMIARAKEAYKLENGNYGVFPYVESLAGSGIGQTQVQQALGINISSNSFFHYGIYPWSLDPSTRIYFEQGAWPANSGWVGYYDYVTHQWGTYGSATPANQYYVPPN